MRKLVWISFVIGWLLFVSHPDWTKCRALRAAETQWHIGFGKVEVTPNEPVRLSGYASRDKPHEGVADPLFARAMALSESAPESVSPGDKQPNTASQRPATRVIVSVDSIAVVASMTQRISEVLEKEYGISRSDFVLCSTHSHAAPHASSGLTNLYRTPLSPEETAAIDRNSARIEQGILKAVAEAMNKRKPARLAIGQSTANFAVNRRVLKDGVWSNFGIQADGPVDRRVQVMRAVGADGKLLGAAFMYACHCTTLGPSFNQVSADWAGLSASQMEREIEGTVFVPVIGCGADANPEPRRNYDDALEHGKEMAASLKTALANKFEAIEQFPVSHFGYAGLAPEMPTKQELEAQRTDKDAARRHWAESMLATWSKMGRLPETYPAPIHTWQFGKQLIWVFLGGEVVVDYQIRFEKSLPANNVWVAAYTDDVFAYVASERMRAEGGYEVDFSMIYYNQPGRWQSGTEDLIERRTQEILKQDAPADKPRDPQSSLRSIHMPDDFRVELVASEPMVDDPINLSFGHDGRVWVVEMADYPLGTKNGGRVRWLADTNDDGQLDKSQVFIEGLNYPTSVTSWRDGILVIAAPDVLFLADRDGDGKADHKEVMLTGIGEANPQHRASGFELGLDGWLNFTSGDHTKELKCTKTGVSHPVAGRDVCWNPDTGELYTTTGHTQFVRARDEFGNWFGNVNNQPIYHYVIEDRYRQRYSISGTAIQHLLDPPIAPPVYPNSQTQDRFNDLFTFNRFTSACSSTIVRVPGLGESMRGAALVCEPVHNLVARFRVEPSGASFLGKRFEQDKAMDWFASSDPFARPVRVVNAPDGTVWIVDMVRQVIEHPEWIPTAWQANLNVRSGAGLGRIYRVRSKDFAVPKLPRLDQATAEQLLEHLQSSNGALRDLSAQEVLWRCTASKENAGPKLVVDDIAKRVRESVSSHSQATVRVQAIGLLAGLRTITSSDLLIALQDKDPRVRRYALTQSESIRWNDEQQEKLATAFDNETDTGVLLQGSSRWEILIRKLPDPSSVRHRVPHPKIRGWPSR